MRRMIMIMMMMVVVVVERGVSNGMKGLSQYVENCVEIKGPVCKESYFNFNQILLTL